MLRLQVTATQAEAAALAKCLEAIDGIEHVEEVGDLMPHMDDADSSSAGLRSDMAEGFFAFDVGVPDTDAAENVRNVVTLAARDLGIAVEFDDAI
ncbi:hypothetical protein [Tahibacter amnicola]